MATPPQFTSGAVLTAAQMNQIGLFKVRAGTLTVSTTPSQITGVFLNSDFPNYKLIITTTATSVSNRIQLKFLSGTTPASSAYYGGGIGASNSSDAPVYFERSSNASSLSLQLLGSAASRVVSMDIIAPNQAIPTMYSGFFVETNNANGMTWGGTHLTGTAYDGFELFTTSGTQTVTYQLYGYRA
jgi:hypothetical protein